MPTYDFECAQCGLVFTVFVHSYNDAAHCPNCHQPLRRLFSPTSALFVAESFKDENIDTLRKWAHEMEHDPKRRKQAAAAAKVARELNEAGMEWEQLERRAEQAASGEVT